jgi:hypothetical protein
MIKLQKIYNPKALSLVSFLSEIFLVNSFFIYYLRQKV